MSEKTGRNYEIKQQVLDTIDNLIDAQNSKGMKKYRESLDQCDPDSYDWNVMINEELIDALQYQQKEIIRLSNALRFYANKKNYGDRGEYWEIVNDEGRIARKALGGID